MTNVILSVLMALMSFNLFNMNYKLSALDKTLFNIPKGVFESSINYLAYHENDKLMFDKPLLETNLKSYFEKNISPSVGPYELSYFYFNSLDGLICKKDACDGIKVTLRANIMLGINYEKSMSYKILENK